MEENEIKLEYDDCLYVSKSGDNLVLEITDEEGLYIEKAYVTVDQAKEIIKTLQEGIKQLEESNE